MIPSKISHQASSRRTFQRPRAPTAQPITRRAAVIGPGSVSPRSSQPCSGHPTSRLIWSTTVAFSQVGLAPGCDCYDICSRGWDHYVRSLADVAAGERGHPYGAAR